MRWVCLLVIAAALISAVLPAAGAVSLNISATPGNPHIGDIVTINGTVTGIKTIAVYLFVTGPDLDVRGVTLDNLNIPAGRGLFTTAPVHMEDGSWTYPWDTSVILGTLKPGNYTIFVVSSPVDHLRFEDANYASTEVHFLPSENPGTDTPLDPVLPIAACITAAVLGAGLVKIRRRE
jgi:hypothetical protein